MEQIWNKEEKALDDINVETKSDAKLKKTFKSSYKTANVGFIAWCVWVTIALSCLLLWKVTGIRNFAFVGLDSLLLAAAGVILAFMAQSANQIVRIVANLQGKDRDFFKEEEKSCSLPKTAAECYGFVKRVFNRNKNGSKSACISYEVKYAYNQHVRNNARSYHSASRSSCASSSGDDGCGDSGDSDSGDPPGPLYHTSHTALKLSKTFDCKSNSLLCPWRLMFAFGCWRLPRCRCLARRWAA